MTDETKIKENQISDLSHSIEIQKDDVQQVAETSTINFEGSASVTDEGGGKVTVTVSGSGSGGDVEIQEDDVQKVSAATVLNFEGDATVVDEGSGKATITVTSSGSGGGTADFSYWSPIAPPASPSSWDDEFSDSSGSVPSGWTEYDQSGILTIDENELGLEMNLGSSTQEIGGIYKLVDNSWDFTVYTKVNIVGYQTGDTKAGIFFSENIDEGASTCDHTTFCMYLGSAGVGLQSEYFTSYNTYNSGHYNDVNAPVAVNSFFLRVRCGVAITNKYYFGYSTDGKSWLDISNFDRDFDPQEFGLFVRSNQGTGVKVWFDFFRVVDGESGSEGYLLGNRIKGYYE